MFPAASICLIRHAEAVHNRLGILCGGSSDTPLTIRGRLQIELLRDRLLNEPEPSGCYCSPLVRATETAKAAPSPLVPVPLDSLREINVGALEGTSVDRVREMYPEYWRRHIERRDDDFAWPGGETYRSFRRRALASLSELSRLHPGRRVLVFTHAGFIAQVVGVVLGTPAGRWDLHSPANASITEVRWGAGEGLLIRFDDHHHLAALPAGAEPRSAA